MITKIGIDKYQEFVFFRRDRGFERHYRLTPKRKLFFCSFINSLTYDVDYWSTGHWYFLYNVPG